MNGIDRGRLDSHITGGYGEEQNGYGEDRWFAYDPDETEDPDVEPYLLDDEEALRALVQWEWFDNLYSDAERRIRAEDSALARWEDDGGR